jgi:cytochrome c peroxidase
VKKSALITAAAGLTVLLVSLAWWHRGAVEPHTWDAQELAMLRSLLLDSLPPLPSEPSNAVADDPRAAAFGHRLFFDPRASANGAISCATCHQPTRRFTDGLRKGRAIGESQRNTISLVGAAWSPWLYSDGRKDSLWSQALSPLEDPAEHGATRMQLARLIAGDPDYRPAYEALFGPLPDVGERERFPDGASPVGDAAQRRAWHRMSPADRRLVDLVFSNIGQAIAAYERLLAPGPARFDRYVQAALEGDREAQARTFTPEEAAGLRLFIGEARCTECHNGPLLTNNEFHHTGVLSAPGELPDRGRVAGLRDLRADPFNCEGAFSDDPGRDCPELRFARTGPELLGAFRTPSLRNLEGTAPFMHKGQLATLRDVIEHYDRAPLSMIGHNEAKPLSLSRRERAQLVAFLETLSAPPATPSEWLQPPADGGPLL